MTLYIDMMVPFVKLVKSEVSDGEGGTTTEWVEGDSFDAAIHRESDTRAVIAEHQDMETLYTVTVAKSVHLAFHDVIRRVSDGSTYRIIADTATRPTPDVATFSFARALAQDWELEE